MRKFLAAALSMAMVAATLTACGGSGGSTPTTAAPTTEAKAETNETSAPAAGQESSAAAVTGDLPDVSGDPKVTLNYAEVNSESSLMGMTAQKFKETVEEMSGGSIEIQIYAGGVFGAEGDVLDTMMSGGGTVDISRISTMSLKDYEGINVTNLLSVPYIFNNREHFWKTVNSEIGDEIKLECHDKGLGIRGLFFVEEGFRNFFFKSEIKDINDLKGKKIRSSTDSTMVGTIEGLGGSPSTVAFNELYSALSSGVVDGAEQPIVNYQSNAFNEVAPYMILDGHTFGAGMVIMTDDGWDKLTEGQQKVLLAAGEIASDYNGSQSQIVEDQCKEQLIADGVTFVEVEDLQPWRDACATIIGKVTAGLEDYVTKIEGFAN